MILAEALTCGQWLGCSWSDSRHNYYARKEENPGLSGLSKKSALCPLFSSFNYPRPLCWEAKLLI